MKRSTQVTLALMTAAGVGGVAYALTPSNSCRQVAPTAVATDPQPDCRARSNGSGSSSHFFSGNSASGTSTTSTSTSSTTSTSSSRGGFGSIGRAFASFGGS